MYHTNDLSDKMSKKAKSFVNSEELTKHYMKDVSKLDAILEHDIQLKMISEYIEGGRKNLKLRNEIIEQNVRFVVHVVKRYTSYGLPFIDLVQEGNLGLIEAVEKFDVDKAMLNEGTISTYAYFHIIRRVMHYIETNSTLVKFNRTNDNQKLFHNCYKLEQGELSHKEHVDLLCRELLVSRKSAEDMLNYMKCSYVTSYTVEDQELDIFEVVEDDTFSPELIVEADLAREHESATLTLALAQLSRDERYIIRSRWLSDPQITLKDLGTSLNISGERVRQIEQRALRRLKVIMNGMEN